MFTDTEAADFDQSLKKFGKNLEKAERQLRRAKTLAADLDEVKDPKTGRVRLIARTTPRVRPYDMTLIDTAVDTTAANHWKPATSSRETTPEPDILDQLLSTVDDELTLTDLEETVTNIWCPEPERPTKAVITVVQELPPLNMATVLHHTNANARNPLPVPADEWAKMTKKARKKKRQWLAHHGKQAATSPAEHDAEKKRKINK